MLWRTRVPALFLLLTGILSQDMFGAAKAPGDASLAAYFAGETRRLERGPLENLQTRADWEAWRERAQAQLREMLGLDPWPERTPLDAVVTGVTEGDGIVVERLHFQSLPGLYATANLYRPREQASPLPAILYLCGHGAVKRNGLSYGNKVHYQHHGIWFARHGYVCLILDSVQLGELEGIHHGTHREGMWWWNSRGYTPAGAEAWNCIRALDYLQSRPEVDGERIGATGRSGGGAYSWWVSALDERVKVVAPVAGITDLQNHVVDGVVEGHCDCMFMVNTHRWDYPEVAALVAPRPLLLVNTDSDGIFPLDGVMRTHAALRRLYRVLDAEEALGLVIGPGPHKDTQNLQVPVFRWMNRHLKGDDPPIEESAQPAFEPEALKVFDTLPADERTTRIHDSFVSVGAPAQVPVDAAAWKLQRETWMQALRKHCFAGWPSEDPPLQVREVGRQEEDGRVLIVLEFLSQPNVPVRLYLLGPADTAAWKQVHLRVLEDHRFPDAPKPGEEDPSVPKLRPAKDWMGDYKDLLAMLKPVFGGLLQDELRGFGRNVLEDPLAWNASAGGASQATHATAYMVPRGGGLYGWDPDVRRQIQIRRRFMLLGQTLHGMRVWDIRQAAGVLRSFPATKDAALVMSGEGWTAVDVLYASLDLPDVAEVRLMDMPSTHRDGPDYLNVLRFLDIPQTVAMAAERSPLVVSWRLGKMTDVSYATRVARQLGWGEKRIQQHVDLEVPQ